MAKATVSVQTNLEYTNVPLNTEATNHLLLKILTGDRENKQSQPLNIVFGADRSGSMGGDKIKAMRKAMVEIIKMLPDTTKISLVSFDDQIEVEFQGKLLKDKDVRDACVSVVNLLEARSMTNIGTALQKSFDVCLEHFDEKMLNLICFFSDGEPTCGERHTTSLGNIVKTCREKQNSIIFYSFGIGDDYKPELMKRIAEMGGGDFIHLPNPESIQRCLLDEGNFMTQVLNGFIGKNTVCRFKASSCTYKVYNDADKIGILYPNDTQYIVLEVKTPKFDEHGFGTLNVEIEYESETGVQKVSCCVMFLPGVQDDAHREVQAAVMMAKIGSQASVLEQLYATYDTVGIIKELENHIDMLNPFRGQGFMGVDLQLSELENLLARTKKEGATRESSKYCTSLCSNAGNQRAQYSNYIVSQSQSLQADDPVPAKMSSSQ